MRSHIFFKAFMCGEVGIRRLGFLCLGDFLSNSKKLVDLQNIQELKFHKNVNSSHQNGFTRLCCRFYKFRHRTMDALIIGKNMFRNIPVEKVLRFAIKYGFSKVFDSLFLKFGKYSPLPKKPQLIIYSPPHIFKTINMCF